MTDEKNEEEITSDEASNNSGGSEDIDLQTLRQLHSDLQHSHSEVMETFNSLSQKTGRLMQFNGTVLALLIAASTLDDVSNYLNWGTGLGIFSIIISLIILVYSSRSNDVVAGVSKSEFTIAVGEDDNYPPLNETSYLYWISDLYSTWIDNAAKKNDSKANELHVAEILTISGIILLLGGILFVLLCN